MAGPVQEIDPRKARSNRTVAFACLAFFGGMIGVSYAAVPLYQLFCQITGYGGTTKRVEQYSETILDRKINIRFDANVSGGLPWAFRPEQREIQIRIGETTQVAYEARNVAGTPTAGRASFNVSPHIAGSYFNKVECFCFTDTTLQPGEKLDMPVVFYVDPAIVDVPELKNLHTITLSYTFFPIDTPAPVAGAAERQPETGTTSGG